MAMDGVEGWVHIAWNDYSILWLIIITLMVPPWIESHALIGYPSG